IVAAFEPLPAVDSRRIAGAGRGAERNLEESESLSGSLGGNAIRFAAGIDFFDVPQHRHLSLGVIVGSLVADPTHGKLHTHEDDEKRRQAFDLTASQSAARI